MAARRGVLGVGQSCEVVPKAITEGLPISQGVYSGQAHPMSHFSGQIVIVSPPATLIVVPMNFSA